MARLRAYRQTRLIEALALSVMVQGAAAATYEYTRPAPQPMLSVRLDGEGTGQVQVYIDGKPEPALRCDGTSPCVVETHRGAKLHLVAVRGEESTFEGWGQRPMRTPPKLRAIAGDPLATCIDVDPLDLNRHVEECDAVVAGDLDVSAGFGKVPEEVEVAWVNGPPLDQVVLPPLAPPKPTPPPIDAEKLDDDRALEVALVPPMPKPVQLQPPTPPPPPPPQPDEAKKPPQQPPPSNMVMVEVPNQPEVDKAPDDATALSDKNRDTAEETRATDTNLEVESQGEQKASSESDDTTSPEVGAAEDQIHQLEDTEATTDDHIEATDHSGADSTAKGAVIGDTGDSGDNGTGTPGLLAMRDIEGRGAITEQGNGKKRGDEGKPGVIKTQLEFKDYERILGKDKTDAERQVAARKMSAKKGRWEKKLEAIKSSLENFIPDVKPGNQTALKTRAAPFALYVARMHRKIHELWGFGFLESLDDKGADFELNDFDLYVNIEISLDPDGTVHKTTIAHSSGKLEFDVAAVDTVISAGPYEETPEAIRSADGRVYLRWGFYRNWRQCGTFNVEPYILSEVPDAEPLDDGAMVKNLPPKKGTKTVTPDPKHDASPKVESSIKDDKALYAANLWVSGYSTGEVDKMVRFSATPFHIGADAVAETTKDLKTVYAGLVVESGKLKDWKLVSGDEYGKEFGTPVELGDDGAIMVVTTEKATFALVLQKMRSGDYRVTQLVR